MSRTTAVERGRRAAEQGMQDTCDIRRRVGESTSGGIVTPTYSTLYTGLPCEVQTRFAPRDQQDVGQASVGIQRRIVKVPMSTTGLRVDDQILNIVAQLDPDLAGRVFVIKDVPSNSYATARRLSVIEVTS